MASVRQSSAPLVDYSLILERLQKNKHTRAMQRREGKRQSQKYQEQHACNQACKGCGLSHMDVEELGLSIMFLGASCGESLKPRG